MHVWQSCYCFVLQVRIYTFLYSYSYILIIDTNETAKLLKRPLTLECTALYIPEEVMYNITAIWSIADLNPLAIEALLAHPFQVVNEPTSGFTDNFKVESRRYPRAEVQ